MTQLVQAEVRFGKLVGSQILSLRVFLYLHLDQIGLVFSLNDSNLYHAPAESLGRFYAPVARDEFVSGVDDHWIQETVPTEALHQRCKITEIFPYALANDDPVQFYLHFESPLIKHWIRLVFGCVFTLTFGVVQERIPTSLIGGGFLRSPI